MEVKQSTKKGNTLGNKMEKSKKKEKKNRIAISKRLVLVGGRGGEGVQKSLTLFRGSLFKK